jgi:O-antigen ligase
VTSTHRAPSQNLPRLVLGILAVGLGLLAGKDAEIALGACAALVFIAVLLADYLLAVGIFFVSTFLSLPGTVAKGIGMVLVLAWIAMVTTRRGRDFEDFALEHKGMTALLLAFVAWTLLGTTWATSPSAVLTSESRYIPNFVVFFVVYAAAGKRTNSVALIAFFVLGAAMAAAYGVIHPPSGAAADLARDGGTLGDPNYFATVLVAALALAAALAMMRSLAPLWRVCAVIACVLSVTGILLSLSRGGLIALGVSLLTMVLVAGRWRAPMAAIAVFIAIMGVGYFLALAPPGALARITTNNDGSGRQDVWRVGWRMVQAHPLNGVGAGNFSIVSKNYVLEPGLTTHADYIILTPKIAHNTYLEVLAEGGIPAFVLFMAILIGSLRCTQKAWRAFRKSGDSELELLAYAQFAALIGFLAGSFFLSEEYSKQLWILLAFGPLLLRVSRLPAPVRERARAAVPFRRGRRPRPMPAAPSAT